MSKNPLWRHAGASHAPARRVQCSVLQGRMKLSFRESDRQQITLEARGVPKGGALVEGRSSSAGGRCAARAIACQGSWAGLARVAGQHSLDCRDARLRDSRQLLLQLRCEAGCPHEAGSGCGRGWAGGRSGRQRGIRDSRQPQHVQVGQRQREHSPTDELLSCSCMREQSPPSPVYNSMKRRGSRPDNG